MNRTPGAGPRETGRKDTAKKAAAVETIAKEIAIAAISKKAPAIKHLARPLVNIAVKKAGKPRKKGRTV